MGHGATDLSDRSNQPNEYNSNSSIDLSDDDVGIIPKGALDPVYEAKARLLNRAVSLPSCANYDGSPITSRLGHTFRVAI